MGETDGVPSGVSDAVPEGVPDAVLEGVLDAGSRAGPVTIFGVVAKDVQGVVPEAGFTGL